MIAGSCLTAEGAMRGWGARRRKGSSGGPASYWADCPSRGTHRISPATRGQSADLPSFDPSTRRRIATADYESLSSSNDAIGRPRRSAKSPRNLQNWPSTPSNDKLADSSVSAGQRHLSSLCQHRQAMPSSASDPSPGTTESPVFAHRSSRTRSRVAVRSSSPVSCGCRAPETG